MSTSSNSREINFNTTKLVIFGTFILNLAVPYYYLFVELNYSWEEAWKAWVVTIIMTFLICYQFVFELFFETINELPEFGIGMCINSFVGLAATVSIKFLIENQLPLPYREMTYWVIFAFVLLFLFVWDKSTGLNEKSFPDLKAYRRSLHYLCGAILYLAYVWYIIQDQGLISPSHL